MYVSVRRCHRPDFLDHTSFSFLDIGQSEVPRLDGVDKVFQSTNLLYGQDDASEYQASL